MVAELSGIYLGAVFVLGTTPRSQFWDPKLVVKCVFGKHCVAVFSMHVSVSGALADPAVVSSKPLTAKHELSVALQTLSQSVVYIYIWDIYNNFTGTNIRLITNLNLMRNSIRLLFRWLNLHLGCLNLYFGSLNLISGFLNLYFGCLNLYFGCLNLYLGV